MSATIPYSAKLTGSTGTTSTATITAPAIGNTLLVMVTIPTASAPVTSLTDNLSNTYTLDHSGGGLYGTLTCYFYRKSNISNAPTSVSVTGTTGSFAATFVVVEVAGMENTSPLAGTIPKTDLTGGSSLTSHTASCTTTNTNEIVLLMNNSSNARLLNSATNGFVRALPESTGAVVHLVHLADADAAGSKSTVLTYSSAVSALIMGVRYKSAKPAVTDVTSSSATEGSPITHTVTLASPTTTILGYSASIGGGTATGGTDYDNDLANATYTHGVTFSTGNFSVPSGVSSFDISITTYGDAIDENDETYVLTVEGISGTGTITDDDAAPTISVSDATENAMQVDFTVSLSAVSGKTITVDYATSDGSKTAGVDYTAITGTLTFSPGETSKTVTVLLI